MKGSGDKSMNDKICKNPSLESQHHKVPKKPQFPLIAVRGAWGCCVRVTHEDRDHENGVFCCLHTFNF